MSDAPFSLTIDDSGFRASLRARSIDASASVGVKLPTRIGDVTVGEVTAFCLGPDEWVLLSDAPIEPPTDGFSGALTDISDREVILRVEGPAAREAIGAGCPRDLRGFATGRAVRTVFSGVSVVLHRADTQRYDVHVWRSFAPHVAHTLEEAAAELAAFPV